MFLSFKAFFIPIFDHGRRRLDRLDVSFMGVFLNYTAYKSIVGPHTLGEVAFFFYIQVSAAVFVAILRTMVS